MSSVRGEGAAQAPAEVSEVLDLFAERSEQLKFPGVDHELLVQALNRVQRAAQTSAALRQQFEQTLARQRQFESELWLLARRGFSYAQVFAESDPELALELQGFALSKPAKARGRKRRAAKGSDPSPESVGSLPFPTELSSQTGALEPPDAGLPASLVEADAPEAISQVESEVELDPEAIAALSVA